MQVSTMCAIYYTLSLNYVVNVA